MKKGPKPYHAFKLVSAVFLMLALLWLTVCLPVVHDAKQQQSFSHQLMDDTGPIDNNEDNSNPLTNTTEEKNPNSNSSLAEEYLHEHHEIDGFILTLSQNFKGENIDTYIAFHGELHVPPPDVA